MKQINSPDNPDDIFNSILEEFRTGIGSKIHNWRVLSLALHYKHDIGLGLAELRGIDDDFNIYVFTDIQREMVDQLKINQIAVVLADHPERRLQVGINGSAGLNRKNSREGKYRDNIAPDKKKYYGPKRKPGSKISHPEQV